MTYKDRCKDCCYLIAGGAIADELDGEWFCDNYEKPCSAIECEVGWFVLKNPNDKHWYIYSDTLDKYADTGLSINSYTEENVWNFIRKHGVYPDAWMKNMWGE